MPILSNKIKALGNYLCGGPALAPGDKADERKFTDKSQFMAITLKVNLNKFGWRRSVNGVLKHCTDKQFQMDGDGKFEVTCSGDPSEILKKIDRSRRLELVWIQSGQCSGNLFLDQPRPSKKPSDKQKQPQQQLPQQQLPNNYNLHYSQYPLPPPYNAYNRGGGGGGGYGGNGYANNYYYLPHSHSLPPPYNAYNRGGGYGDNTYGYGHQRQLPPY